MFSFRLTNGYACVTVPVDRLGMLGAHPDGDLLTMSLTSLLDRLTPSSTDKPYGEPLPPDAPLIAVTITNAQQVIFHGHQSTRNAELARENS